MDTYVLVLVDQIVDWVADQRLGKGAFERWCYGLTPEGRQIAKTALKAIIDAGLIDHDYSSTDMVEDQGWREVTHTLVYSRRNQEELRLAALSGLEE
jgi:hypothetical protein